jgi:CelD/BcsL family acetyltransferase involved in cellulose biosynthesis
MIWRGEHVPTKPRLRLERLDTAVIGSTAEFAALEKEWDELYQSCPAATPFQSWAWLFSWWEAYQQRGYSLRLITLRRPADGLLVGILPLMIKGRRLLFLGTGVTDYLDILVREGYEEEVLWEGVEALEQLEGWYVADLQQLRPEAAARALVRQWEEPWV